MEVRVEETKEGLFGAN